MIESILFKTSKDSASDANIEEIINFIENLGDVSRIRIWGDEPLEPVSIMRTLRLAKYCLDKNMRVQIDTNGQYEFPSDFNGTNLESLLSFKVRIDDMPDIHNTIHGPGSFEKAYGFIKGIQKRGIHVTTITLVHDDNIKHIADIISLLSDSVEVKYRLKISNDATFDKTKVIKYLKVFEETGGEIKNLSGPPPAARKRKIVIDDQGNIYNIDEVPTGMTIYDFNLDAYQG